MERLEQCRLKEFLEVELMCLECLVCPDPEVSKLIISIHMKIIHNNNNNNNKGRDEW